MSLLTQALFTLLSIYAMNHIQDTHKTSNAAVAFAWAYFTPRHCEAFACISI